MSKRELKFRVLPTPVDQICQDCGLSQDRAMKDLGRCVECSSENVVISESMRDRINWQEAREKSVNSLLGTMKL